MLQEELQHILVLNRSKIENFTKKAIHLEPVENQALDFFQSKIGGWPYVPKDTSFPEGTNGHLLFLAQINFAELPPNELFPSKGILQFFINDDALFGKGIKGVPSSSNYAVRFFSDPILSIDSIHTDFNFIRTYKMSPIDSNRSFALHFKPKLDIIAPNDDELKNYLPEVAEAIPNYISSWDPYLKLPKTRGHKLAGYAHYPVFDMREHPDDLLLFQLDSDTSIGSLWGDMGTGAFFIRPEDWVAKNFEAAYFNWACFNELME